MHSLGERMITGMKDEVITAALSKKQSGMYFEGL